MPLPPVSRKKLLGLCALFFALYAGFTLAPLGVYLAQGPAEEGPQPAPSSPTPATGFLAGRALPGQGDAAGTGTSFSFYDQATGEAFSLTAQEFLPAALACEMDPEAPAEALKAQAVALLTYYTYLQSRQGEAGAVFTCDTQAGLVYAPASFWEERWGEAFSQRWEGLEAAAKAVEGQLLTWDGEPICAAFFAISGGSTVAADALWGEDLPYLPPVASPGDCLADGYLSSTALTASQLQEAAQAAFPGEVDFSGPQEDWLAVEQASRTGYVEQARLGGRLCTGEELRQALGLRSAWFTLNTSGDGFQFTVRGWGHGVGMSQAGAVFMAQQGAGYREILAHYYPGAALQGA